MATLLSLNFLFENAEHSCLITTRLVENKKIYKITVMNGELEQLLHGENYIKEEDGLLETVPGQEHRYQRLKHAITQALQKHLDHSMIAF